MTKNSRVLVVMPHPDDEAVFLSGVLQKLSAVGIVTKLIVMTRGEASTNRFSLSPDESLPNARYKEMQKAAAVLGIKDVRIEKYPDGRLEKNISKIIRFLKSETQKFQPTHIFCLEPDGIYGHPDHIALTRGILRAHPKQAQICFATVTPRFIFPPSRSMATKEVIAPIAPEVKISLSFGEMRGKVRAILSHLSQFGTFPRFLKPAYFFLRNDMLMHEYIAFYKQPKTT